MTYLKLRRKKLLLQTEQLTKWQFFSLKMTAWTILSEIDVILCICMLQNLFTSQLEISQMLNGTTLEIQHKKWGPQTDTDPLLICTGVLKNQVLSLKKSSWTKLIFCLFQICSLQNSCLKICRLKIKFVQLDWFFKLKYRSIWG